MQIRAILALMLLGFAGTMAVHWSELSQWWSHRAPPALSLVQLAALRTIVPASSSRAASAAGSAASGGGALRAENVPVMEPPPLDSTDGPPLPVMLAVRSGAPRSDSPAGDTELDLVNTSDEALTITILVADAPKAQLFVPPGVEQHLGTDSGLDLEPGSQVTLRSSGYRQLTETVR